MQLLLLFDLLCKQPQYRQHRLIGWPKLSIFYLNLVITLLPTIQIDVLMVTIMSDSHTDPVLLLQPFQDLTYRHRF